MWHFRPGVNLEQSLIELEREFGLDNITDIPVATSFPTAAQNKGNLQIVEDSGTLYLVLTIKEKRYRAEFTEF